MDVFASALAANPMQTRQDAVTALLDLIRPLKAFYSAGGALLKVGNTAAHYGEKGRPHGRLGAYPLGAWSAVRRR